MSTRRVRPGDDAEAAAPPGGRELIVFSHGNSFPGATYRVMLDALRARGWRAAAVDKYGHDPRYPVTNNWPHLVEQLHDFALAAAAEGRDQPPPSGPARTGSTSRVWLVGHSLGGFLSLMCAAMHPALVRGVVMLDSPIVTGWRANALRMAKGTQLVGAVSPGATSRRRRVQWDSAAAALEHFRGKKAFASWDPRCLADYVAHGTRDDDLALPAATRGAPATSGTGDDREHEGPRRVLAFDRDIETAIYNTVPHHVEALLRRHPLQAPVSFVGGTHSREIRQVGMVATTRITQGRVAMLEGTHLFPMEKPEATAAFVDAALLAMRAA
jgi:pimeloyl-ACP methyl ester carboxylesterase